MEVLGLEVVEKAPRSLEATAADSALTAERDGD
jgi:hypothetical protein